jgi:DNA end-binding protein Ku
MQSRQYLTIAFGMVNIKVGTHRVFDSKEDVRFNLLHSPCGTPVKQPRRCLACDRPVSSDEVVHGYPTGKNRWLILSDEEVAVSEGHPTIELAKFVPRMDWLHELSDEVKWLLPTREGVSERAYWLLWTTMRLARKGEGVVAVASCQPRGKQHPTAIEASPRGLLMHWLHDPRYELFPDLTVPVIDENDSELKVARQIVAGMTGKLAEGDLADVHNDALRKLVADKLSGKTIDTVMEPEPLPTVDLMEALRATYEQVRRAA